MNREDPCFSSFNVTLDDLFKKLRNEGVGAESRHTEPISTTEEDQLWDSGVLNVTTPLGLLRCVFFMLEHHSALEGSRTPKFVSGTVTTSKGARSVLRIHQKFLKKNRQGRLNESKLLPIQRQWKSALFIF